MRRGLSILPGNSDSPCVTPGSSAPPLQRARHRHIVLSLWLVALFASPAWAQAPVPAHGLNPNFGTYSLGEVGIQLVATGSTGTYTWQVVGGALPPGVSLRTDSHVWPSWIASNTSGMLLGVATTPGTYNFTLRVTSGGISVDQNATIRVSSLAVGNVWDLPRGYLNKPYSEPLIPLNATGPVTWTFGNNGVRPPGISLSPTGIINGMPTATGFYNFDVLMTSGGVTVFRWINLEIHAVEITSPAELPPVAFGASYNYTLTGSGGTPPYTFSTQSVLSGLVLDPSGAITGTSTAGRGMMNFQVTMRDANGVSTWKNLSINTLFPPQQAARMSPYSNFLSDDCTLGWVCEKGISANSGGTAPFTWTISGQPPGMDLAFRDYLFSNHILIGGQPTQLGTFNVQVTVTDALGISTTNVFPIRVSPLLNRFDSFKRIDLVDGLLDVPYSSKVAVTGGVLPHTAAIVGGQLPPGLLFDPATLTVSGTPTAAGSFNVDFEYTDAIGQKLRVRDFFTIDGSQTTVSNGGTIFINTFFQLGTATNGNNFSRTLTACCLPSFVWTAIDPLPPGLTLSPAGIFSGTPTTNGDYRFRIRAADAMFPASNWAEQRFFLTVASAAPFLNIGPASLPFGNVGTLYNVSLTATGGPGTPTWALVRDNFLPPGMTLTNNGTLSGTPTHSGQFAFSVTATDGTITTTRFYSLFIYAAGANPPLDLPLSTSFFASLGQFTIQFAATGGAPPYHFALSPGATPVPGMRVQDGQPLPTNFPSNITGGFIGVLATPGVYTTSVRVTDSTGAFLDRVFTLTAFELQILSQGSLPKATLGSPYSFTLQPYGGSGNYFWSATNLPPGISINSSGQLQGTPTTAGNFFPTFTIGDLANGTSRGLSHTLVVDPFAITPNGELPDATVGTFYSQVFQAPGCQSCTLSANFSSSGLSFNGGVLSGTPTGTATGLSLFVTATGTNGTVQKLFSLKILSATPQPLSITTSATSQNTVGGLISQALFASGGAPPYAWTLDSGLLPPGISLGGPGETIGSNLLPGFTHLAGRLMVPGVYTFTVRVTDSLAATTTRTIAWNVTPLAQSYFTLPLVANTLRYGQAYSQPLLGLGGTSNYTWTTLTAMPPGLVLDPTGLVSGTPANTGSFSPSIQLTDDAGNLVTNNVTFNVVSPTGVTVNFAAGPNLGTFVAGSSINNDLGLNGGTAPYTVTALTALPPGLSLLSGSSLISGGGNSWFLGGTALSTGTFNFTLHVTDSVGNVGARTFTLAVSPLSIITSGLGNAAVGLAYMQPLISAGGNGAVTWSLSATSVPPPGLLLSPGGVLSGIPTQAGNFSFTVVATDATANVITRSFTLTVAGLAITDPQILPNVTTNVPYTYTFSATGGVGTLVWSATTSLPGGLSLSPTGTLSGTSSLTNTSFSFTVAVTDGVTTFTRRFTTYHAAPVPIPFNLVVTPATLGDLVVGQATFLTLPTPAGGVAPYTWAIAGGSTLPPGLSLVGGAQVLPTVNPGQAILAGAPSAPGTYTFDLVATDSTGAQLVRTFMLNVSTISLLSGFRIPSPGAAYSQQLTTVGGVLPYTYTITPNSPTIPMLPPGITMTSGGLLSGTTTSSGLYQARVTVTDGAGHRFTRLIAMTVVDGSGSFVSVPTSVQDMTLGTGRTQILAINNSTTLAATWSLVAGTPPPGISIHQNTPSAGLTSLAGRPTALGTYVFTLRAAQPFNPSNFVEREFTYRVVSMQIVSPPVELIAVDLPGAQIGQPYSTTIKIAGGTPPYIFTPNPLLPMPAGLSLSSSGVLSGTPQQRGFQTIGFDVTDAAGHTATSQQVSLTIAPSGRPLFAGVTGFGLASVGVEFGNNIRGVLDLAVRGGTRPFSWSVNSGSTLPPGMKIIPGGNGVSDVLGGAPTTAGSYTFSLDVIDSAGRSATFPLTLFVASPSIGPQSIPNGVVGSPYSATLTPTGGAPPYGILQLLPGSDLPPGLTLSPGGLLSGTPTTAGNFLLAVQVFDSNGQNVVRNYRVTINNAAGEARPIAISPNPVQVSHVQGSPIVPTTISVNGATGIPFTAVISGIPGASLTATSGTTPATIGLNLNLGSLSPGTYSGFVGVDAPTAANLYDFVPVVLTVLPPAPCTYAVNPASGSVASGFSGGSFSIATGVNCAWTATPSATWITIVSAKSSSGPGNVSYFVTANPTPAQRTGNITVNGAVYSITQFGTSCSFVINPTVINAPAIGGSAVVSVTASNAACNWTASGLSASPSSGTGNGAVTVSIPPNLAPGLFGHTATIAGQTLTVNQVGVGCSVSLSSSVTTITAAGGQGAVQVTAPVGCSYDTVSGPNWISVTSGGLGNGTGNPAPLIFNVAANSTTVARSGALTIGGQTFQIDQDGLACSVTVDTSGLGSPYGPNGGVGLIGVTTNGSNCSWNASSAPGFATVSPPSGIGNGTVSVTVSSNAGSTIGRNTSLTIGGQSVPLQQSGTTCTFSLQSSDGTVPASGGSGAVGVVSPAACTWPAVSNNLPWLSVQSTGGAGSSSVQFVAQANTSASPRVGTLTVAGLTYTVTQAGAPCTYNLNASALNVASAGASSSFSFTTAATGCVPSATSFTNWVTGVATSFNGVAGTVSFTVDPSPYTTPRTGTIQLGDKTFTITQTGGACGYSLSAYGALFGTAGGTGSVLGTPTALGCVPATGTTQPTIITLSPLAGPVSNIFTQDYTVTPFTSLTPTVRKGQITFGGLLFTVKQSSY